MAEYRTSDAVVEKRRSPGTTIAVVLIAAAVVVALLFATGFWSADVKKAGSLPEVSVKGGALPSVDLDSKKIVVGTKKTTVDVPKVKTEKETLDVPTLGVTSGDKK